MSVEPVAPQPRPEQPRPQQRSTARSNRGRYWLGFVLGFALLMLVSCGGMAAALGFNRLTLADLRGDNTAWTPPTLIPTPPPPAPGESAAPVANGRFSPGQTVFNMTGSRVNLRQTPGHVGKASSDVLTQLSPGDAVVILGETTSADNLAWWRVAYQGMEGWVAEATASGVEILGQP
jgi:hypothetical protein